MVTESTKKLVGNEAFEGYAIDLISEIAQILKFNYTFKWVDDGAYGYKNKETGEWNGLMGEILTQVDKNFLQNIDQRMMILQGDFFHWYPPKKLKYGKPRLGESTLT